MGGMSMMVRHLGMVDLRMRIGVSASRWLK